MGRKKQGDGSQYRNDNDDSIGRWVQRKFPAKDFERRTCLNPTILRFYEAFIDRVIYDLMGQGVVRESALEWLERSEAENRYLIDCITLTDIADYLDLKTDVLQNGIRKRTGVMGPDSNIKKIKLDKTNFITIELRR